MEDDEIILIGRAAELAKFLAERDGCSHRVVVERALEYYGKLRRSGATSSPGPSPLHSPKEAN